MIIFERSQPGRRATLQAPYADTATTDIPNNQLRSKTWTWPCVGELEALRHYTRLSRNNFSIDTHCYPLGSCTMKYNPRGVHRMASIPGFLNRHPLAVLERSQGYLQCIYELQEILKELTGMQGVSLTPMAGAQGEFAGVAMIKAYHESRGDYARQEILIPDAAHGTNPASAIMCGYQVREIPTDAQGDIDMAALKAALGPQTAGIMLTNPSTLGVFERRIQEVAKAVHEVGGLLYYDGANLNAILGKVRPGDMGFDVMHMNLHKTFATPHGGGGPGSGPIAVGERLLPFMPIPVVGQRVKKEGVSDKEQTNQIEYYWCAEKEYPKTIGRLSGFMGNAAINLRAYLYIRLLGCEGLTRVAEFATLNANYLMKRLQAVGYTLALPKRRATHEFIVTLSPQVKTLGVNAMDVAKRLLDYGFHAPTTYFPLLIPECLLIEPTETESKQELDRLVAAMATILKEAQDNPELLHTAPHTMPVRRLDDVKAARDLDLIWKGPQAKDSASFEDLN